MKSMSARQSKVANAVHHAAVLALLQGRVPTTLNLSRVTVVDCWVSADLRLARLYLQLPQGTPQAVFFEEANALLAKPLRKLLAEKLATKYIPALSFHPAEDE